MFIHVSYLNNVDRMFQFFRFPLNLLIRILNSGIPDSGLIAHLSEATVGSLIGVGHSTFSQRNDPHFLSRLAVTCLFLANDGVTESTGVRVEPFNVSQEQNDYEARPVI